MTSPETTSQPRKRHGCLARILIWGGLFVLAFALLAIMLPKKAEPAAMPGAATATVEPTTVPSIAPTETSTATPTRADMPTTMPTTTLQPSTPQPTQIPLRSGGLGLTAAAWEERYGLGVEAPLGWKLYADTWEVPLFGPYVDHIERLYESPVSLPFAQGGVNLLLPQDRTHIETYSPPGRPEAVVELYHSPAMGDSIDDENAWIGGEPGQFIVIYKVNPAGTVDRVIVATGNNP